MSVLATAADRCSLQIRIHHVLLRFMLCFQAKRKARTRQGKHTQQGDTETAATLRQEIAQKVPPCS